MTLENAFKLGLLWAEQRVVTPGDIAPLLSHDELPAFKRGLRQPRRSEDGTSLVCVESAA